MVCDPKSEPIADRDFRFYVCFQQKDQITVSKLHRASFVPPIDSTQSVNIMATTTSQWSDIPRRLATICVGIPIVWGLWLDDRLRVLFWEGTHMIVAYEFATMASISLPCFLLSSLAIVHCVNGDVVLAIVMAASVVFTLCGTPKAQQLLVSYFHGWMLISLPFRKWVALASSKESGFSVVVNLMLTAWNCDTGALLIGRITKGQLFGDWALPLRRSLSSISPNKSLEGMLGGIVLGTATFMSMSLFWDVVNRLGVPVKTFVDKNENDHFTNLAVGLMLSFSAVAGDLWESKLKRLFLVKDSGKLLPGHGGILDRFDSSLITVVVFSLWRDYLEQVRSQTR